ncbi:MAG: diacylglycerol kinase family lipid kinase [Solirubrobacterales bacterium]|nr:diacylglycerol kinase family lipid kinase [Solirubrobacterales bacterium]
MKADGERDARVAGSPFRLIVNPTAGGGRSRQVLPRLERALDARRCVFQVTPSRSLEHGIELALGASDVGEVPVVVSGDGLIGAVGGALAGSGTAMGILPAGRGNDLARGLGIPTDPEAAVECLVNGKVRDIDVGEANGERFLGIASVGFDSDANRIANEARLVKGTLVYTWAALRALAGWKPARFTLREGDAETRTDGYTVAVANNRFYGGGMKIAPDAELDDGLLDVITIGGVGKLGFLLNLPRVFRGTHVRRPEVVSVRRVRSIEISASRPFTMYADGDPLTDLPARVRVLPGRLSLIVPADSP